MLGKDDVAGGLHQSDVARRGQQVGALVVGHLVGDQHAVVVGDLDVTARGNDTAFGIVAHLVGGQQNGQARLDRRLLSERRLRQEAKNAQYDRPNPVHDLSPILQMQ